MNPGKYLARKRGRILTTNQHEQKEQGPRIHADLHGLHGKGKSRKEKVKGKKARNPLFPNLNFYLGRTATATLFLFFVRIFSNFSKKTKHFTFWRSNSLYGGKYGYS